MADEREARELIDHVLIVVGNDDLHGGAELSSDRRWNSSGSTLPPESTATTILFFTSSLPAISAASATAPPGSTTSFNSRNAKATAAATSASVAADPLPDQRAVDGEGELARRARHQRVADRSGERRVRLALPAAERAGVVVEARGLRGIDARCRRARLDRERDAGREPAARGRNQHHLGSKPERREVLDDLAPGGALTRDHQRVIIGRHQRRVAARRDVACDRLAVVAAPVVEHDLGAKRGGALALGARRVARHDDHRRHVEQLRRRRYPLRVVAGGIRHYAAGPAIVGNRGELVVGAAELERAGALQGLGLEEHARPGERIEHRRGHERRAQRHARKPKRCGIDIGGRRQVDHAGG